jgi:hypothetical protein
VTPEFSHPTEEQQQNATVGGELLCIIKNTTFIHENGASVLLYPENMETFL